MTEPQPQPIGEAKVQQRLAALEASAQFAGEHIATLQADLGKALARIAELEEILWVERIKVKEGEAYQETGHLHRWCPVCHKCVRTFSRVYMDHPAEGGQGKCPNSLQQWTRDRFHVARRVDIDIRRS